MQNSKFSPQRITVQLIDVENGIHLWSEKYDRVLNDVFEVQDEIAVPSSKS
jgi:adenylate cyclase